jgi:ketosteroid isomerase-like protein
VNKLGAASYGEEIMKILPTLLIICLAIPAVAQQGGNAESLDDEMKIEVDSSNVLAATEFKNLAEIWRQAYNSKDAANLSSLYAQDAQYISAHVDGYIADGHDAVIENFQRGMDSGGYIDSVELLSINSSCGIATVVSRYRGTAGGQKVDGRNLLVWKKIKGKWLVVTHMTVVKD